MESIPEHFLHFRYHFEADFLDSLASLIGCRSLCLANFLELRLTEEQR